MNIPSQLFYTKDHEWVKIEGDIATVGITDFAQGELGDIVYIEIETIDLPEFTFNPVKTVSDLMMPVSGEILSLNEALESTPELINTDPYEAGWLVKIKVEDQGDHLLSAEDYRVLIGG